MTINSLPMFNQNLFEDLCTQASDGRLPHAFALVGPAGIGKSTLARALARAITDAPVNAGFHPDIIETGPNEELKTRPIDITAIRKLTASLTLRAGGKARVALILEAERMLEGAANALLKTLEEPPADTFMILVAQSLSRLPATIRSRLAVIRVPTPDPNDALTYLNETAPELSDSEARKLLVLANGAPEAAVGLKEHLGLAQEIARLARGAADQRFDRVAAQKFAETAATNNWAQASALILRLLHLVGLAAGGIAPAGLLPEEEKTVLELAKRAGAAKAADAWRNAAEIKRSTEDQNLAKPWNLYRMCLAIEWLASTAKSPGN